MKKILALALAAMMLFAFVACGTPNDETPETTVGDTTEAPADGETTAEITENTEPANLGELFYRTFVEIKTANPSATAEEVVTALLESKVGKAVQFPMVMPVEPGFLQGFSVEINGFESAATLAPGMMGVAFVSYVFDLAEGADVNAFIKTLEDNHDTRWNMCTEAEMMLVKAHGNSVFFIMCATEIPSSVSGKATIVEPTVEAGSASETLWNEFKTVMSSENGATMIAADVVDALAAGAFAGTVTYVEEYSIENEAVFAYSVDGFNNASFITAENALVYVIQLDEGMDVANWMSYYFDGIKADSYAYGAYNNTMILMVNVG